MDIPAGELIPLVEETALRRGARAVLTVSGSSMGPLIRDGDRVEIASPDGQPFAVGDVVLARRTDGSYLLHRVVRLDSAGLYLQGDAQRHTEGPFSPEHVVGRVTAVYRGSHRLPTDRPAWRATARVWVLLAPVRPGLLRGARALRRIAGPLVGHGARESHGEAASPSLDSEHRQLLALLRSGPDCIDPSLLSEPIDWPQLMGQAAAQEVLPLVCDRVGHLPPELQPPPDVKKRLDGVRLHAVARTAYMRERLSEVLAAIQGAGVPTIALKGSHLVELVYRNPALRQMVDIDILVHPQDLDRARQAVEGIGWKPDYVSLGEDSHHDVYVLPASQVRLEAHWTFLCGGGCLPADALREVWARARGARIAGVDTLVLSDEDLLLNLVMHIYCSHQFAVTLRHVRDIAELIRAAGDSLDWGYIDRQSRALALSRALAVVAVLLREWFALDLPVSRSDPEDQPELVRAVDVAEHLILGGAARGCPDRNALQLCHSPARLTHITGAWRKLFLPRRQMQAIYGSRAGVPWIYLLYAARAVHLTAKYAGVALRSSRPDGPGLDIGEQARVWDWLEGTP